jgi:hypothetical protein
MTNNRAGFAIYSTTIPLNGWTGLPLLGVAAAMVWALPAAALVLVSGLAGGALIASTLIRLRAR